MQAVRSYAGNRIADDTGMISHFPSEICKINRLTRTVQVGLSLNMACFAKSNLPSIGCRQTLSAVSWGHYWSNWGCSAS